MNRHDLNVTYSRALRYDDIELLRIAVNNSREYARSSELRAYLSSLDGAFDLSALLARIDAILAERPALPTRPASSSDMSAPLPPPSDYLFGVDPASTLAEPVRWCWVSPCRVRFFGSSQAIGLIRQEVDPLAFDLSTPGMMGDAFGYWFTTSATPRLWVLLSGVNRRVSADLLRYDDAVSAGQIMVGSNSAADMFHAADNTGEPFPPAAAAAPSPMPLDESDRYERVAKRHAGHHVRTIRARLVRVRAAWPGELKTAADEYMANSRHIVRETVNPTTLLGHDKPPAPPEGASRLWEAEPFSLVLHRRGQCTLYKLQLQGDDSIETLAWLITYAGRPDEAPSSVERREREYTLVLMAHNTRVEAAFPMSERPVIERIVMELLGAEVAWRFAEPSSLSLTADWEKVASSSSSSAGTLERWDLSAMND